MGLATPTKGDDSGHCCFYLLLTSWYPDCCARVFLLQWEPLSTFSALLLVVILPLRQRARPATCARAHHRTDSILTLPFRPIGARCCTSSCVGQRFDALNGSQSLRRVRSAVLKMLSGFLPNRARLCSHRHRHRRLSSSVMVAIPVQQPVFAAVTVPSVRADAALNLLS